MTWLARLAVIAMGVYMAGTYLLGVANPLPYRVPLYAAAVFLVTAWAFAHAGRATAAAWLLIVSAWGLAAVELLMTGWGNSVMPAFIIAAALSGVLFGARTAAWLIVASIAAVLGSATFVPDSLIGPNPCTRANWGPAYAIQFGFLAVLGFWASARSRRMCAALERQVATALKRTSAILESTHGIVVIIDAEGRIAYENAAVERVLGYAHGERVGRSIAEFVHPDAAAAAATGFADVMTTPGTATTRVLRCRHKSGGWRTLETAGRNMFHVPAIAGILGVGRDVTERLDFEARARAAERLEAISRLAGGIAHDFNNLLTVVLSSVELARLKVADGEAVSRSSR